MKYDIYYGDADLRFALGKAGTSPLFVIGINPSSADASRSDPTIRKVEEQLEVWKELDGFLMLNLYPVRAPRPTPLREFGGNLSKSNLSKLNIEIIKMQLGKYQRPTVWAAWGDAIDRNAWFVTCLHEIVAGVKQLDVRWKNCESLTGRQNPRHPLSGRPHKIKQGSRLTDFDIMKYLSQERVERSK